MKISLTFDDGLKDHILYVAPILEKHGYKGLFCITTGSIGKDHYMSWDDVRCLARNGHEIAAHSVSHKNLLDLYKNQDIATIQREIRDSKRLIEDAISAKVRYFAFPHNAHNRQLLAIVRENGMEPVSPHRINLGGPPANPVDGLCKELMRRSVCGERFAILMFHGIADRGTYACFPEGAGAAFEKLVTDLKKYDSGPISVVRYSEVVWPIYADRSLLSRAWCKLQQKIRVAFGG